MPRVASLFRAVVWIVLIVAAAPAFPDSVADSITNALQSDGAFPDVPDTTDVSAAYAIQARVVETVYGTGIAGYKAGLTSPAAQQRFGVDKPVLGVLPK